MSKLDELRRTAGGNASESMGTARTAPMPRASAPVAAAVPDRMQGITRSKTAAEIPVERIIPDPDQPREEFEPEALERPSPLNARIPQSRRVRRIAHLIPTAPTIFGEGEAESSNKLHHLIE